MKIEEYNNIHQWIIYHYGKAVQCENIDCKSIKPKRFEWALKRGNEYAKDISLYIQLCPSCHRKYDFTESLRNKLIKSHAGVPKPWKERPINQLKKDGVVIRTFKSLTHASSELKISLSGIANALSGLSKSSGGYRWGYKNV